MKKLIFTLLLALVCRVGFAQNKLEIQRLTLKKELLSAKNDTTKVDMLYNIAFSYVFAYPDTAIIYAKHGLELSEKLNYENGEKKSLLILGLSLNILGNSTAALHYGFEYLALCQKSRNPTSIAFAYNVLMIFYRDQEDYKESLKYATKALNIIKAEKAGDIQTNAQIIKNISSVFERDNQLDSALYYGLKSNEILISDSGLFLTLGNIYAKLGKRDLAINFYRKGAANAEEYQINIDLIDICNGMSIEYEKANKRDSSIYYANKSIRTEGVHNYPEGELRASIQLAHLYEKQGLKDSTIKYLKLSDALRNNLFNRQKTREAQSLAFNEKIQQQELLSQKQENQNKTKMYVLLVFIIASLLVTFLLWRNNRHKQHANNLLQEKNEEIQRTLSALKATQTQLIQSEKLASLGELTAGIAHEIQNPLNFVNNFAEMSVDLAKELKEEVEKPEIDKELIIDLANDLSQNQEKINFHGKRAASIVTGMLQHSQASSGKKELTDINKLADESLRLSYHGLRAKDKGFNADFELIADPNLPKINVIPQDIGRVLINLINNAFYAVTAPNPQRRTVPMGASNYTPKVTVSTSFLAPPSGAGATDASGAVGILNISVTDNGTGISEAVKAKIFQPFFTTKPTGQGTGLGLSLAYDIITKGHGGTIEVESIEGEGTTFIVKLPV